jgi:dihydrofolate reductase
MAGQATLARADRHVLADVSIQGTLVRDIGMSGWRAWPRATRLEADTMGDIRVHEFMSLDGVIDEPRWTFDYGFLPTMGEAIAGAMAGCQGILLGRTTYEMFEPAWSPRTAEEDPGAPFMNDTMKYVVSSTLEKGSWRNSEIVGPYSADAIRRLKERVPGGIYVSGSGTLVRAMLADGLVDELHLFVYPLTRGEGPKLFDGTTASKFTLARSEVYDNGVLYVQYRPAG